MKKKGITLFDFADNIHKDLVITRHPQGSIYGDGLPHFVCYFQDIEIKDGKEGRITQAVYGEGRFPKDAMKDYVRQLRGKLLVLCDDLMDTKQEHMVPKNLRAG